MRFVSAYERLTLADSASLTCLRPSQTINSRRTPLVTVRENAFCCNRVCFRCQSSEETFDVAMDGELSLCSNLSRETDDSSMAMNFDFSSSQSSYYANISDREENVRRSQQVSEDLVVAAVAAYSLSAAADLRICYEEMVL